MPISCRSHHGLVQKFVCIKTCMKLHHYSSSSRLISKVVTSSSWRLQLTLLEYHRMIIRNSLPILQASMATWVTTTTLEPKSSSQTSRLNFSRKSSLQTLCTRMKMHFTRKWLMSFFHRSRLKFSRLKHLTLVLEFLTKEVSLPTSPDVWLKKT